MNTHDIQLPIRLQQPAEITQAKIVLAVCAGAGAEGRGQNSAAVFFQVGESEAQKIWHIADVADDVVQNNVVKNRVQAALKKAGIAKLNALTDSFGFCGE
nr:hypothetical protein [Leisingera sp. NJS201]